MFSVEKDVSAYPVINLSSPCTFSVVIATDSPLVLRGDTSCCKICFFSAAELFLVGVELFRFFRGEGVPDINIFN